MILFDDNVITVIYLDFVYTYLLNISPTSIVSKIIISAPEENFKKKKKYLELEKWNTSLFLKDQIFWLFCVIVFICIFFIFKWYFMYHFNFSMLE